MHCVVLYGKDRREEIHGPFTGPVDAHSAAVEHYLAWFRANGTGDPDFREVSFDNIPTGFTHYIGVGSSVGYFIGPHGEWPAYHRVSFSHPVELGSLPVLASERMLKQQDVSLLHPIFGVKVYGSLDDGSIAYANARGVEFLQELYGPATVGSPIRRSELPADSVFVLGQEL